MREIDSLRVSLAWPNGSLSRLRVHIHFIYGANQPDAWLWLQRQLPQCPIKFFNNNDDDDDG